jgi:hypothetical protein
MLCRERTAAASEKHTQHKYTVGKVQFLFSLLKPVVHMATTCVGE